MVISLRSLESSPLRFFTTRTSSLVSVRSVNSSSMRAGPWTSVVISAGKVTTTSMPFSGMLFLLKRRHLIESRDAPVNREQSRYESLLWVHMVDDNRGVIAQEKLLHEF